MLALLMGMAVAIHHPAVAQDAQASCAKADFELVVDQAAASLRDLNNKNRPLFQDKLRALKEKRGWTNDQFMTEAAPYVKDDEIEVYDEKTNTLLDTISTMGQEGANAEVADCTMLSALNGHMQTLVETQKAKWDYMFKKLETAISKP